MATQRGANRSAAAVAAGALSLALASGLPVLAGPASAQEARPNRIKIEYVPPTEPRQQNLYNFLKERRALEKLQEIFSPFRLANDVTIRTKTCGMSNAWYQRPTVTLCYEYLEDIQKSMPKEPTPAGLTPADVVIGQFFYVAGHEMGHALFDQINVPLFGAPEDSADRFSAYMMLLLGKQEAWRLIGGAAYSYKDYIANPKIVVPTTAFAGAHGAPMQRFYTLLCLAYGADQTGYVELVDKGYLPRDRANGCRIEYGELNFAFQQLIRPHVDPQIARAVLQEQWLPRQEGAPPSRASDLPAQ